MIISGIYVTTVNIKQFKVLYEGARRYSMRRNERPFTLIELLIVISIIAILASMLLPALYKARARAKAIQCAVNLKSVAQMIQFYADDNRGYIPKYAAGGNNLWSNPPTSDAKEYFKNRKVLYCPTGKLPAGMDVTDLSDIGTTCWYTYGIIAGNSGTYMHFATRKVLMHSDKWEHGAQHDLSIPVSQMQLFADSMSSATNNQSYVVMQAYWYASFGTFSLRHANRGNMAFFDGHVEPADRGKLLKLNPYGAYANENGIVFKLSDNSVIQ